MINNTNTQLTPSKVVLVATEFLHLTDVKWTKHCYLGIIYNIKFQNLFILDLLFNLAYLAKIVLIIFKKITTVKLPKNRNVKCFTHHKQSYHWPILSDSDITSMLKRFVISIDLNGTSVNFDTLWPL